MSLRRCLAVLFVTCATAGCNVATYWLQPETVSPNGEVFGTPEFRYDFVTRLQLGAPGQTVKMWLQPSAPLCAQHDPARQLTCHLDGKLVRLEGAESGVVTGIVIRPTSLVIQQINEKAGKQMPMPAGEVHVAIGQIKAFGRVVTHTKFHIAG